MAGKSTISITFKLDGDTKNFKELAKDADGLKKVITSTVSEAQKLNSKSINFAAMATGIDAMQRSVNQLHSSLKDLADAYAVQEVAETQLATVMRQRMGATDAEIQSIKELASAQQELGVIGDEVQLSGAQQVATFLKEKASLDILLPAMNNLLAQQKGLNATTQDAVSVGNLMGKVMQGQTSALTRVGITFTEAEEQILKYGTESQRAATLAQVIANNVGDMNAQLAKTDSGKQKQLSNALGDIKERLGGMVNSALPFVTIAAQSTTALAGVTTLAVGIKRGTTSLLTFNVAGKATAGVTALMGVSTKRTAVVMRVFSGAMKGGVYSATALKLALRGLLMATGVGVAIVAVTTALEAFSSSADEAADKEKQLADAFNDFKKEIRDIGKVTGESVQQEVSALDKLYAVAKDETKSRAERAEALRALQNQYPDYFRSLSTEIIDVSQLTTNYESLRNAILDVARARAAEKKIEENTGLLIDVEQQRKAKEAEIDALNKSIERAEKDLAEAQKRDAKAQHDRNWFVGGMMAAGKVQPMTVSGESVSVAAGKVNKFKEALKSAKVELIDLTKRQGELNAANRELADIAQGVSIPSTTSGGGKEPIAKAVYRQDADNLKEYKENIQALNDELQTATAERAAEINKEIALWRQKAEAIENAGKAVADNTPLWREDATTLQDINNNIQILANRLQTATAEEAVLINQQIDAWNAKADAIKSAGKAINAVPKFNAEASTLKDITQNIEALTAQLQTATIDEAAIINQQIKAWNDKADAIKNAGKEAERTAVSTGRALTDSWSGIKNIGSSIDGITESLKGNGSAWQTLAGIVDSFIQLYEGIQTVISVINMMTAASTAHATAKGIEATAETTAAVTRAASATTATVASTATITANKLEAASFRELAASQYMAAHAFIPFAGYGIAAGFTSAMMATVKAAGIPMLAEGGIASGPTLAMVGEYAGAKGNPEVIAPLDKLRSLLLEPNSVDLGTVKFEIQGRKLVGILAKENEHKRRS